MKNLILRVFKKFYDINELKYYFVSIVYNQIKGDKVKTRLVTDGFYARSKEEALGISLKKYKKEMYGWDMVVNTSVEIK